MEPLFENTTVRTEEIDKEFCRYVKDPNNYTVPVFMLLIVFGFLVYCTYHAIQGEPGMGWLIVIFCGLLAVTFGLFFWQDRRTHLRERKELKKNFGTADLENHVSFFENEYHLTCEQTNADVTVRYSEITKITLTPSLLLLTRLNKATTILARDGFSGKQDTDALTFFMSACAGAKFKDRT